jgi:hypothetical protein
MHRDPSVYRRLRQHCHADSASRRAENFRFLPDRAPDEKAETPVETTSWIRSAFIDSRRRWKFLANP